MLHRIPSVFRLRVLDRRHGMSRDVPCLVWLVAALVVFSGSPLAALSYQGASHQFAGGFSPSNAPDGGFGGGSCTASRVPVVFVHGNGDKARNWDYPSSTGVASVYDTFKAAGYNDAHHRLYRYRMLYWLWGYLRELGIIQGQGHGELASLFGGFVFEGDLDHPKAVAAPMVLH